MPIIHLAARSRAGLAPFESAEAATWSWRQLREGYPDALGAVLMPNHLQLVVGVDEIDAARARLARMLGHLQRWLHPGSQMWEPVREPKIVPPGKPVSRELRYLDLNAPRAGLVDDPLVHVWSTLRDVVGAVVDPWVDAPRLARALRSSPLGFADRWHRYVSGDPSVAVEGTPPPRAAPATMVVSRTLQEILSAAGAALRLPISAVRESSLGRRLFAALACHQGWTQSGPIAAALGVTRQCVNRFDPVDPRALEAAALCLGDRRLLMPFADDSPLGCGRRFTGDVPRSGRLIVEPSLAIETRSMARRLAVGGRR